ncbi:MAG: acetyl-CoA carboxylase biotin carboxyl carrier protein [Candidatus Firestonebacteria bacterium]
MNIKEIKELIDLIHNTDVAELELEREGTRIRIRKASGDLPKEVITMINTAKQVQNVPDAQVVLPQKEKAAENLITITAPMVGTFYRANAPDASPYVQEGDVVADGQTICIIEAMKLMNEIKSETKGKIVKILVESGHAIEYGQPLFLLEPVT